MASTLPYKLVVILFISQLIFVPSNATVDKLYEKFEDWMTEYSKVYKSYDEKLLRFDIFKKHYKYIKQFNKIGNSSYTLGLNEFSDLTHKEFLASASGYKAGEKSSSSSFKYKNKYVPYSGFDWRKKGAVNKIKNQLSCGSSWSFAAVSTVESINKIINGKLISLSEQELIGCDNNAYGCFGGSADVAYKFIIENGGIATEKQYPYTATDGYCDKYKMDPPAITISKYEDVPQNSEESLMKAVYFQPVAVGIDISSYDFMHYKSGIYDGECGFDINHVAVAIGYKQINHDGLSYWIVRNSWGTSWGEKGYMRMLKDVSWSEGMCGITLEASYPII